MLEDAILEGKLCEKYKIFQGNFSNKIKDRITEYESKIFVSAGKDSENK